LRISSRAESIAPFFEMEFGKRAAALEAQGLHVVKLSIGEPDFGAPPPAVIEAAQVAIGKSSLAYPSALGLPALRNAIPISFGMLHNVEVDPSRVVVTATGLGAMVFCERLLDEAHIALTPGVDFGYCGANKHICLSYAASIAEIHERLSRLGGFFDPAVRRT
jgi:aspartate/methionine/tyrosine aminotransferase